MVDTVIEMEIAQLNVARLVAPTDSLVVAEFMDALDEINALADASPGFVWRFQTEDGNFDHLRANGPTPYAFTFRHRFAPDDSVETSDPRDACPA